MERLNQLIKELNELNVPTARVAALKKAFQDAGDSVEKQNAALENMSAVIDNVRQAADFAGESFRDLTKILENNNAELDGQADFFKKAMKGAKAIADVSRQMMYNEEEITDYTEKQLANKIERAQRAKADMSLAAQQLATENGILGQGQDIHLLSVEAMERKLALATELTEEEKDLVRQYQDGFQAYQGTINRASQHLEFQKQVNEKMGITGGLIKGLTGLMGKLGIEGSAVQHGIENANAAMKKAAKDGAGKLKIALIGVGEVTKGVVKQLNDPVFIGGVIVKFGLEGADHITEMQRSLGQSVESGTEMVYKLEEMATASGDAFITTAKLGHAVAGLSAEAGTFASKFDKQNLIGFVELTENLGYATEQASHLITTLEMHDQTMNDFEANIERSVNGFNEMNNSNITLKAVMDDIMEASQALHVTIGETPNALIEASVAARGLGTTLKGVESIADSLLDFNSSIEAEMEAQLMTGKSLNLARAREAALVGDLETVAKEVSNQQAVQEAFATNNVLAQRSVAKALGMSREELADMYKQQQLQVLSQKDGLTAQEQQTLASLKARKASEQMADILGKIKDQFAQAFLPVGKAILQVMEKVSAAFADPVFGSFLTGLAKYGTLALVAFKSISYLSKGVKFLGSMFNVASKAAEATANVISSTTEAAANAASQASQNAGNQGGGMIERFNKLDTKSLIRAAGAMVILSAALYISAKAFQEFADVKWQDVALGVGGMLGLAVVAKIISKGSKEMIMGAVAIGLLGLAMIPLATALSKLAGVNMDGVLAAAAGLVIFSAAAFALGALFSSGVGAVLFGAGLLGIMALAVAIQPLGKALTEAAPGFSAFGQAMSSLSIESAKALALTGVGLVGLTAGLLGLAAVSLLGSPIGMLSDLAALAPGLAVVGTSLTAIAAGVSALSSALDKLEVDKIDELKDLVVTTAFAAPAVAATGAITELISGITGGGGDSDKALLDKIDRLIAAVESGGDVYIDGNKAGRAINLATYKSA